MIFSSSITLKRSRALPQHTLYKAVSAALLMTVLAGCSNNTVETATSTDSVSSKQVQHTPIKVADSDPKVVEALQANLSASGIEEKITAAVPTDMEGIYWVTGDNLPGFFTDQSGKHIIQGQIVSIGADKPVDISAKLMAKGAQDALEAVDTRDMIVYPAKGETKSVVYAFTDADCGYCRKLHSEMDDINARGIEVRYLAWPRSEQTVPKMNAIWCSEDRQAAMNQAKMGADVIAPSCTNPVAQQMALGKQLGVRGTPAIFTASGQQIGGYLPAAELAQAAIAN